MIINATKEEVKYYANSIRISDDFGISESPAIHATLRFRGIYRGREWYHYQLLTRNQETHVSDDLHFAVELKDRWLRGKDLADKETQEDVFCLVRSKLETALQGLAKFPVEERAAREECAIEHMERIENLYGITLKPSWALSGKPLSPRLLARMLGNIMFKIKGGNWDD